MPLKEFIRTGMSLWENTLSLCFPKEGNKVILLLLESDKLKMRSVNMNFLLVVLSSLLFQALVFFVIMISTWNKCCALSNGMFYSGIIVLSNGKMLEIQIKQIRPELFD